MSPSPMSPHRALSPTITCLAPWRPPRWRLRPTHHGVYPMPSSLGLILFGCSASVSGESFTGAGKHLGGLMCCVNYCWGARWEVQLFSRAIFSIDMKIKAERFFRQHNVEFCLEKVARNVVFFLANRWLSNPMRACI